MKPNNNLWTILALTLGLCACSPQKKQVESMNSYEAGTFGYDLCYLKAKDSLVVLTGNDGQAQVIVSPKYQAKVFTSTAEGLEGKSLGYLNYKMLDSKEVNDHMNGYGGENRFWLGPEGGRYSVYFAPGTEQVYDNWHTPKPIDIEPWNVIASSGKSVNMKKEMQVRNYQGTDLRLNVDREISLLESAAINSLLGIKPGASVRCVAYATSNTITNLNDFEWNNETGTICIWMLDMFNTAPNSLTIVPFNSGDEKELGRIATTDYFGEIPADRLKVQDGLLFLRTDGNSRNKLGMNARRTKSLAANYDPDSKRLTIATFDVDKDGVYLNQEWNPAKDPLVGDALNAYNDGPLDDGSIMGPFLEIESASPGAFLKPAESLTHNHHVFHFVGEESDLTAISEVLLGISIQDIKSIFQ